MLFFSNPASDIYRKYFWLVLLLISILVILFSPGRAQAQDVRPVWDMKKLGVAPKWTVLDRPAPGDIKAVFYTGLPYKGNPTRVFAWLGIPKLKPGEKDPGIVLVHGGHLHRLR